MSYPDKITKTMEEFQYISPKTVPKTVSILAEANGKASVLAGGTNLVRMMMMRVATPEYVVDVKNIADLAYIQEDDDGIKIGALTTISALKDSKLIRSKCVAISEAANKFGTPLIRNMATIGGNICRSSPAADMAPPLMVLDAMVKLIGPKGERKILLENFFTGPGQNVLDQELLTEILIPKKSDRYGYAFEKIMRNTGDLAKASCAVGISVKNGKCDDLRIALGAVADRPIRAKTVEMGLKGKAINDSLIETAAKKVVEDISPITDVRSTDVYRTEVSKVLVQRLIKLAIQRI